MLKCGESYCRFFFDGVGKYNSDGGGGGGWDSWLVEGGCMGI